MKKIFLALCMVWTLQAADHDLYNHSLEAVGSYSFNDDDMLLEDNWGWGLRYNYNVSTVEAWEIDAYQVSFDYQCSEKYTLGDKSAVWRLGVNALWYMDNPSELTPFALVGFGGQFFTNESHGTVNGLFGTIGGGVEYQMRGDFSIVGETKYLYSGDESALVTSIGIKYSFGQ